MDIVYPLRYSGPRWQILAETYAGVQETAVNELQRLLQEYLPYVIRVSPACAEVALDQDHLVLIGTSHSHPHIRELVEHEMVAAPVHSEGYTVACLASPWGSERKLLVITGADDVGVLYGVQDFAARVLYTQLRPAKWSEMRSALDGIAPFSFSEFPRISYRGIWTWGYVIYDYRRFIDQMARLRLNTLTIWNDCPPHNTRQILDYAHARGVQVVFGFHWGWGVPGLSLDNREDRCRIRDLVVATYREQYADLGLDGIYFQTLTEHHQTEIGGQSVAAAACALVNETAEALFDLSPDLSIQFGLHATSILDRYMDLAALDPRVMITWEDAGVLPYSYQPQIDPTLAGLDPQHPLASLEKTVDYSRKLATFRPGTPFALVPKGWTALRWVDEFEHHGPFVLGEREWGFIERRRLETQPRWDAVDSLWLIHFPHAARFYREMLNCQPPSMLVTGLIEDGVIELGIPVSVSLFAQTLWNPFREDSEILRQATSGFFRR